jgi:hypothetical protein
MQDGYEQFESNSERSEIWLTIDQLEASAQLAASVFPQVLENYDQWANVYHAAVGIEDEAMRHHAASVAMPLDKMLRFFETEFGLTAPPRGAL